MHAGTPRVPRHLMEANSMTWKLGDSICAGTHTSFITHGGLPVKGVPSYGGNVYDVGPDEPFNNAWCTHAQVADTANNTAPVGPYSGRTDNFVGDYHEYKFPIGTTAPASDNDIFQSRIHGMSLHLKSSDGGHPEDYYFRRRISTGPVTIKVYFRYNAGPVLCVRAVQPEADQSALRFGAPLGTLAPDGTFNLRAVEFTCPAATTAYDGTKNFYTAICGPLAATPGNDGIFILQRMEIYNPALTGARSITCGGSNAQSLLYSNPAILSDAQVIELLAAFKPTVIGIEAGFNDARAGVATATIEARLNAIIDRFEGFNSSLMFLLRSNFYTREIVQNAGSGGTLIDGVWHYGANYAAQAALNATHEKIAKARDRVYYCDAAGGATPVFSDVRYLGDTIHPSGNDGSNVLMAGLAQGLQAGYAAGRAARVYSTTIGSFRGD